MEVKGPHTVKGPQKSEMGPSWLSKMSRSLYSRTYRNSPLSR